MSKKFFSLALCLFISIGAAFAQTRQVSGTVTDATTGDPVVGAAVQLKGSTTRYSMTDALGNYSISVPADATLTVSMFGYLGVDVPVEGKTVVNITLKPDTRTLEDALVIAYGTSKKEAITGSVATVSGQGLAEAPVSSVDKMLSGKLAGVTISAVSGQPGAASQIRIRGNGSINASNSPLWVVDGIPVLSGDISFASNTSSLLTNLNPSDIESITVLKDAAAASAYGSRAANGVILVTTKSGKEGDAAFTATAKYGVNWLQSDAGFRMMTAREALSYQRDAIVNAGMDPDDPTSSYYRPLSILQGKLYNPIRDFTKLGQLQEYEISARGGNSKSKYYSSFSYHKNDGTFYGVYYEKLQGRVNASYKLRHNLETGIRLNYAYTQQVDVPMQSLQYANPLWTGETSLPWDDINHNGDWSAWSGYNGGDNPRSTAKYDDQRDSNYRINATVNLKWTPLKNLVLETKESIETIFMDSRNYFSPLAHDNTTAGQLETYHRTVNQITTSNTASYSNTFGGYHNFHAVIGQEAMRFSSQSTDTYSPVVDPNMPYHNTADQTTTQISQSFSEETMLSFFGIADYNYDNRIFVQGTIREDGSSLFGADNKWGLFWSASASWNIASEKWFKNNVEAVNLLKIRGSYGVNGNNGISPYKAYGLYGAAIYNGLTGYLPSQLENRVLSWERNKTLDFGLDFGILENTITGSIDWYNRKTVDLLLTKQIPQTTGFSTIFSNVGSMKNTGVEIQLEANIIQTTDMLLSIGGNVAFNRTKILDLGGDEYLGTSLRNVVGMSMYNWYLYDYYGVNPSTGEALWVTEDGSLTNQQSKARRYYAGSPEPKAVGGFNLDFQWKGLTVGAAFEFKAGNKVCIWNEHHYLEDDGADMSMNKMYSSYNYWKQPGDTGCNPKPVAGQTTNSNVYNSDRWVEDGSYLRFKDFTVGYSLPENLCKKISMKGIRVYVSGLNLYCWNDVNFWDPEQGVTGNTAGQYPTTKSIVGGLEFTF
ncbi:MAG: SusC/RagA family TonB-linked outer membrane protein [Bacteroidales bacterium]|nr:SusC/RagA family TonB-linked outer membrane protein [Bacteroidales bacterium]